MQDFHRQLHDFKEQQIRENGRESHLALTSEKDAIVQVSKQIALSNLLICFDEFHVTDIADALILSHIFETFYKSGSVVFATSNHAPENLYMNGLNRMFFLPFISLITTHSRVIDISSSVDYRKSLAHPVDDVVLTPARSSSRSSMSNTGRRVVMANRHSTATHSSASTSANSPVRFFRVRMAVTVTRATASAWETPSIRTETGP